MGKKKLPLVVILWKIIIEPAWYWLVTIVPAAIALIEFFRGNNRLIPAFPLHIWWLVALAAFLLTIFISTIRFVRDISSNDRDDSSISIKSRKQSGGQTAYSIINVGNQTAIHRQSEPVTIDIEELKLAKGGIITYPDDTHLYQEEYEFTWINNSGQDLKKCFILLDGMAIRSELSDGKWQIQHGNEVDKPLRWNRNDVQPEGKIDIDNNDRASFTLIKLIRIPALNIKTKETDYLYDYRLALLGNVGHPLYNGWDNRLMLGFRAKLKNGESITPISYLLELRVHNKPNGIEIIRVERLRDNKAAEQHLYLTGEA